MRDVAMRIEDAGKPHSGVLTGRLRFGGFSTSSAAIQNPGVVIEVKARLLTEIAAGTSLRLRLVNVSAAAGRSGASSESAGLEKGRGNTGFEALKVEVTDGSIELADIPKEFVLGVNYPNPFNPATWIRYELPELSNLELVIFSTLGQKVRTLVNVQNQPAGDYSVKWNGRNENGQGVASGVYFYELKAKAPSRVFIQTRKMMLLR